VVAGLLSVLSIFPVLSGSLAAQEKPKEGASPLVPELAKFARLIGDWEGSGTVRMSPQADPMPWTSRSTATAVLGGRFLRTEMRIEFGPGAPAMVFRSFYGLDPSTKKLVAVSVGNTGECSVSDRVSWVGDDTLVVLEMADQGGVPMLSRSIVEFVEDEQRFRWEAATGAGAFTPMVEGTMQRSEKAYRISAEELSSGFMPGMPTSPEMEKLARIAGEYTMTGDFTMSPGAEPVKISSRESIRPIFGGAALFSHVRGDPIPGLDMAYEAFAYITWHAPSECYREIYLTNMGEFAVQELRFLDDRTLVSVSDQIQFGQPVAARGLIKLGEDGGIIRVALDRMSGAQPPERAFTGEYTREGALD